ncbi:protein LURP-one-related 5-like [Magnolia sinica]|uniref:protein LURP-one-related 5-like n=1 Tax=Magnolia sinica TaxID=86752 RepID=UPI00265982DB|nr:protein LURP-one-related 5-like [Magnolia sinica]
MGRGIVEERYCNDEETQLTVLKTSLFFSGDGFTVYDPKGDVVFRVDSYGHDAKNQHELVLMDPTGNCILTVRRKRPSLHHRWEGFLGERIDGQKPIFSVRRSSIIGRSRVTAEVYGNSSSPVEEYEIQGSFSHRNCTFYNTSSAASTETVAEIKRKVSASANVVLGKDVFCLCLRPRFDAAFAMGLVLVLDQINGDDDDGGGGTAVDDGLCSSPPVS